MIYDKYIFFSENNVKIQQIESEVKMSSFDLIEYARRAQSAEELIKLARAEKIELSEEDAQIYFERWHDSAAVSDDELDAVSGGVDQAAENFVCEFCGSCNLGTVLTGGFYCYDCNKLCNGKKL